MERLLPLGFLFGLGLFGFRLIGLLPALALGGVACLHGLVALRLRVVDVVVPTHLRSSSWSPSCPLCERSRKPA